MEPGYTAACYWHPCLRERKEERMCVFCVCIKSKVECPGCKKKYYVSYFSLCVSYCIWSSGFINKLHLLVTRRIFSPSKPILFSDGLGSIAYNTPCGMTKHTRHLMMSKRHASNTMNRTFQHQSREHNGPCAKCNMNTSNTHEAVHGNAATHFSDRSVVRSIVRC